MSELSQNTEQLIGVLYKQEEADSLRTRLENECGTVSLGCEGWSPSEMERIRFAVLKLGALSQSDLEAAIKLANTDWRDLLMAAGFGEDIGAHEKWRLSIAKL